MTIYDIPQFIARAYTLEMTPSNITSGFQRTIICSINRDIFADVDFAPSNVTFQTRFQACLKTSLKTSFQDSFKTSFHSSINITFQPGPSNPRMQWDRYQKLEPEKSPTETTAEKGKQHF